MKLVALIAAAVAALTTITYADVSGPPEPISITFCKEFQNSPSPGLASYTVTFVNLADTDATAVEIDVEYSDAFGEPVYTAALQKGGTFSPGVSITAEYSGLVAPPYTAVRCYVKRVLFDDGTLWPAPLTGSTSSGYQLGSPHLQPNEQQVNAQCHAASQADDNPGIVVYCTQAAEDHQLDADAETGNTKAIDLANEAANLILIGLAHNEMRDGTDPVKSYRKARMCVTNAAMYSKTPQANALIKKEYDTLSKLPQ